jgi:hypothetical protein
LYDGYVEEFDADIDINAPSRSGAFGHTSYTEE